MHTWERILSPGSIWEFNMEHHLGKGMHLNQIYDFDVKNKNHPSGYVFVVETIGDRRCRIVRDKDNDFFQGYSPVQVHMEFSLKVGLLYEMKNGQEEFLFYRKKRTEEDFEEGSEYDQIFTPDRESRFHVD